MAQHPHCAWNVLTGSVQGEPLVVELHPLAWPERVARIEVAVGGEVFSLAFAGYNTFTEVGYEDSDKRELLEDRINESADLAAGPTRITRDVVDGITVRSRIVLNPDGPDRRSFGVTIYDATTYLKARLRLRTITREVIDFPAMDG